MTSIMGSTESTESAQVSAIPGSTGIIQGTIRYEDKEYGPTGFTGNRSWKTVRYAAVDVVDTGSGAVLSTAQTDSLGNYSLAILPGTTQVYVRVNSSATPPASGTIRVNNLVSNMYGVPSDPFPLTGSAFVNISIPVSNIAGGAFNILDVMTTGYEFFRNNDGAYPGLSLSAFWAPGNGLGTYYCTSYDQFYCSRGSGIYVLNEPLGDTDDFDDDVLWHEFGHYLATNYSADQSPGGAHYLTDNDHDLRFSWSEGWGNFLPGAVKSWLAATDPSRLSTPADQSNSLYVDTSGASGWSFDFGLAPLIPAYYYASGEVAVANVLLVVRAGFSMKDIWDIFRSFKDTPATTPANLELFWDRWIASKPTTSGSINVQTVFEDRQILYQIDSYEPDIATATTITVGNSQSNHTLYSDDDSDFAKFTPLPYVSYTIRTSSLRNGADTVLELYDDKNNLILFNDNDNAPYSCNIAAEVCHENGNDVLSSTISLPASVFTPSGPYTIKVYSSLTKPASAGRYGTYNLIVTSP